MELPQARPAPAAQFAQDVREGLSRAPKSLPAKYFYDRRGSRLFQRITQLEEYYLTRCEGEILRNSAQAIVGPWLKTPLRIVELGAGDGHKTEMLLEVLARAHADFRYVAVDICREAVAALHRRLPSRLACPAERVRGLVADYAGALRWLGRQKDRQNLVLFLGSSIGNLDPAETRRFFRALRAALRPGDAALVGFDLKKPARILHRAYNDSAGVTRQFNLNLLDRINRELGADFDRRRFRHRGFYNPALGRMESWLVSRGRQRVAVESLGQVVRFEDGEGIHMENSYKYDLPQIERIGRRAGFALERHLLDSRGYFADSLWRVPS